MSREPSDKSNDRRERNAAAMRRLEELLQDPGPGITVRRIAPAPPAAPENEPSSAPIGASLDDAGPSAESISSLPAELPAPIEASAPPVSPTLESIRARLAAGPPPAEQTPPVPRPAAAKPPAAAARPAPAPAKSPAQPKVDSAPATKTAAVPAAKTDELRHLTETARGRLTSFFAGGKSTPPAIPAAAAKPARASGTHPIPALMTDGDLRAAILASRRPILAAGLFSFVINILMLAGPLFMLQVYDRVMTSGSLPTLIALALMTAGLYGIIGILELVRSRVITRVGVEVDQRIGDRVFKAALHQSLSLPGSSSSALRELDNLRQFLASPGLLSFFDAPWTPVYLLVIFIVHWMLGLAATFGAVLLVAVTWFSETRTRGPLAEANIAAVRAIDLSETGQRNSESIMAMGMLTAYRARWQKANRDALAWQVLAADKIGSMSSLTKTLRLLGQSLMLAIGAALALKGEISSGSIIAGTIIFGRALSPVEQAIGHWRSFLKARESYVKIEKLLAKEPEPPARTALPSPAGHLEVSGLRVAAPDTRQLILSNVAFTLAPGQMLAVIGPSASGKSTLARTLVGLWPPFSGTISLDGARLDQWDPEALGRHLGFLPQTVELFGGTVKDNIARFLADAGDTEIVEAAKQAHAHDMILALPRGYDTELGNFGTYLSSGQRQRIGLARALFRNPALVVLDEPNANLDRAGDEALAQAIDGMRERGQAIVLVSHRVQAIGKADLLLYLDRGIQRAFGPRREVMKLFQAGLDQRESVAAPQAPATAGAAPAVARESGVNG